jgi:uncharacterized protein YdaU (DUF1376 family)
VTKLEWFPFWAKDWVTDEAIVAMSAEARGIYITLLAFQWIEGDIPEDTRTLCRFCAVDARSYRAKVAPVIRAHFVPREGHAGRLVNPRLSAERDRQLAKRERLARNGAVGAERRWQKPSQMPLQLPQQLSSRGDAEAEADAHQHLLVDSGNGRVAYPEAFEQVWTVYPERAGGNPKRSAFKAWSARLKDGATADDILAGVERYRRYCETMGKVGTEFVKQAATFLGPDEHFREEWAASGGARTPGLPDTLTPAQQDAWDREQRKGGAREA